jgi:hypothetical protein
MKRRIPKWPQLEEALSMWLERIFIGNCDIDSAAILNKATKFAADLILILRLPKVCLIVID